MDLADIGRVYHYLLKYRQVESRPTSRRIRSGESEVALILRSATPDQLDSFNQFLAPQGLKLVEFDDSMSGVATAGYTWILARTGEIPASSYISTEKTFAEMNIRGTDSRDVTAVWFLHVWLIYLSLIYTRAGRGVSEISGYVSATFSRDALIEAVQDHLARLRSVTPSGKEENRVTEILDQEKGRDVERRVTAFVRLMCTAGLLQEVSSGDYQQTLLGAHEVAELYSSTLRIPIEDVLKTIVNITTHVGENEDKGAGEWD